MDINDNEFEKEVIEKSNKIPVIVDFWAPWCMPCLMLSPILEQIEKDYKGKFIIAKVNVDQNREKASEYGVMGIPSVKLFKKGEVIAEFVGAKPEQNVKDWLNKNL